jgi:4-hydroxy-tetrahydrodipicolinate reductase
MKIRIALMGRGRMGQEILRCAAASDEYETAGVWVRENRSSGIDPGIPVSCHLPDVLKEADVAIDFTLPDATDQVLDAVADAGVPLVCGVSGLPDATLQHMAGAASGIPILYDRNMSLGIAVMQRLVRLAGAALGDRFEAEIHETHHVHKIDAPSGTALQLGEALAEARGCEPGDIHYEVTRRGEVPGEHTVLFRSPDETLALRHEVSDRRVFAVGALGAAAWLVGQPPGLYSMQDMVADKSK